MPFVKTAEIIEHMNSLYKRTSEVIDSLSGYSDCIDSLIVKSILETLKDKTTDFFSEDRKLHIAVIGQVKAGKSTFLNELLFPGQMLFPFDNLPKTSVLTKIEYAEKNEMLIEYIDPADLGSMRALSKLNALNSKVLASQETIRKIESIGFNIEPFLEQGSHSIEFSDISQLFNDINDYVGDNGRFTPLVKCVTISLNLPELKEVVIVDTPGLNDPVMSRTAKTKEYIETCDAAFFLSRAGTFLDDIDCQLFTELLPQKGVKNLILAASQFDSAIMNTIYDYQSIEEAVAQTRDELKTHAVDVLSKERLRMIKQNIPQSVIRTLESQYNPLFISAVAERMRSKPIGEFSENENIIYKLLSTHGKVSEQTLADIGGFDAVRSMFNSIIKQKDDILQSKANEFVTITKHDIVHKMRELRNNAQHDLSQMNADPLTRQYNDIVTHIQEAQEQTDRAFRQYLEPLSHRLKAASIELNALKDIYKSVIEKQDVHIDTTKRIVSDARLFMPWTWGKKHSEYDITEHGIDFLDTEDCIQNITYLAQNTATVHVQVFEPMSNLTNLRNQLNKVSSTLLFWQDELPDMKSITHPTDVSLRNVTIPKADYDCTPYVQRIHDRFMGRIMAEYARSELAELYSKASYDMLSQFYKQLENYANTYARQVDIAKSRFTTELFSSLYIELKHIRASIDELTARSHRYEEVIELIERFL